MSSYLSDTTLATVVIGGLITSTLLTLYLLPVLYPWFSPKKINPSYAPQVETSSVVERA